MIPGWFPTPSADVVHECRRCGTTVDEDADACTECGSEGIARYRIR